MPGKKWTVEEDAIILARYAMEGSTIAQYLPGRSANAIGQRALKLGVSFEDTQRWTPDEDVILRRDYPTLGSNIPALLNTRTRRSIATRASTLGISFKPTLYGFKGEHYTATEIRNLLHLSLTQEITQEFLDRISVMFMRGQDGTYISLVGNYTLEDSRYVHRDGHVWALTRYIRHKNLPFSAEQVRDYARRRHVSIDAALEDFLDGVLSVERFTKEEDAVIKEFASDGIAEIMKHLPGRSVSGVRYRAQMMGVHISKLGRYELVSITRSNVCIQTCMHAFCSSSGVRYVYVKCAECGSIILCSTDEAILFRHGEACTRCAVPIFLKLPSEIRS